jgi:hypothetical protein
MATEKQIAANRENAKKSTGPASLAAKARVRYNALKHGLAARHAVLIPGEDPHAYNRLVEECWQDYRPDGDWEGRLVKQIATLMWRIDRINRIESGLLRNGMREAYDRTTEGLTPEQVAEIDKRLWDGGFEESFLTNMVPDDPHDRVPEEPGEVYGHPERIGGPMAIAAGGFTQSEAMLSRLSRYETNLHRNLGRMRREFEARQNRRISRERHERRELEPFERIVDPYKEEMTKMEVLKARQAKQQEWTEHYPKQGYFEKIEREDAKIVRTMANGEPYDEEKFSAAAYRPGKTYKLPGQDESKEEQEEEPREE